MHRTLISILVSSSLMAAEYSLPAGRLPAGANWNRSDYGVQGGIPDSSLMTVFTNFTSTATAAQISAAAAICPSNQVIALAAGVYTINNEIELGYDGVVLRGAGPTNTFLNFTGGDGFGGGLIEVSGTFAGDSSGVAKNWTAGLTQGSTVLTLANVTDLDVGDIVSLDQLDDSNIGATANGETFLSRLSGTRPQAQLAQITAINGNQVTVSHMVSMTNFQTALTAQLNRNGTPLQMIGIEDMTISNAAPSEVADYNIYFQGAWNCWIKNVNSRRAETSHMRGYWSGRIEIRHCDFRETWDYASQSYGANVSYYASWWLIEDNIFEEVTTPQFNWGAGGNNIFIFNALFNTRYDASAGWQINTMGTHGAHQTMCLYEGNYAPNMEFDFIHGSSSHNTAFRNRLNGRHSTDMIQQTYPVILERNNRFISIVGNVLGYDGYHIAYRLQNNASPGANDNKYIFKLGYASTFEDLTDYDTAVTNTIIIAGNYNTVDDAIPAAESIGSDTLPDSFLYDSTPSWWPSGMPYPPFSPSGAQLTASLTANSWTNLPAGWRYQFGSEFNGGGGGGGGAPSAYGVTARVGSVRAP